MVCEFELTHPLFLGHNIVALISFNVLLTVHFSIISIITKSNDLLPTLRMRGATLLQPVPDKFTFTIMYKPSTSLNCRCPWKPIICNGNAVEILSVELQIEEETVKHSVLNFAL